jgi:hypothetical protein
MADTMDDPQERAGTTSETEIEHDRGDEEAVTGRGSDDGGESQDVDPDSAEAEVDRDDTIDEI